MQMDDERQKKGLSVNEIEMSGTVIDVKNVFPFSLFLAVGRGANIAIKKKEPVPFELKRRNTSTTSHRSSSKRCTVW